LEQLLVLQRSEIISSFEYLNLEYAQLLNHKQSDLTTLGKHFNVMLSGSEPEIMLGLVLLDTTLKSGYIYRFESQVGMLTSTLFILFERQNSVLKIEVFQILTQIIQFSREFEKIKKQIKVWAQRVYSCFIKIIKLPLKLELNLFKSFQFLAQNFPKLLSQNQAEIEQILSKKLQDENCMKFISILPDSFQKTLNTLSFIVQQTFKSSLQSNPNRYTTTITNKYSSLNQFNTFINLLKNLLKNPKTKVDTTNLFTLCNAIYNTINPLLQHKNFLAIQFKQKTDQILFLTLKRIPHDVFNFKIALKKSLTNSHNSFSEGKELKPELKDTLIDSVLLMGAAFDFKLFTTLEMINIYDIYKPWFEQEFKRVDEWIGVCLSNETLAKTESGDLDLLFFSRLLNAMKGWLLNADYVVAKKLIALVLGLVMRLESTITIQKIAKEKNINQLVKELYRALELLGTNSSSNGFELPMMVFVFKNGIYHEIEEVLKI
jgi:hypothetical protein